MVNQVFQLPLDPPTALNDPLTPTRYHELGVARSSPIVIDFGSYLFRAGFASDDSPRLRYPPYVARIRDGPGKSGRAVNCIGYDALSSMARSAARSAFEGPLAINPWNVERLLDGTLTRLGLGEEKTIDHPFLVTEPVCNPNGARAIVMEIIFEAYNANKASFGVDALYSYLYNTRSEVRASPWSPRFRSQAGFIISCGYNTTTMLPIVDGRMFARAARRLSIGGSHMTNTMAGRLQLLHPEHSHLLTYDAVTVLKENVCYVSEDYVSELEKMREDPAFFEALKKAVKIPLADATKPELSPEELERKAQLRAESGKRLQELLKTRREQKEGSARSSQEQKQERIRAEQAQVPAEDEVDEDGMMEDVPFTKEEAVELESLLESRLTLETLSDMKGQSDEDDFYLALAYRGIPSIAELEGKFKDACEAVDRQYQALGMAKGATIERKWRKRKDDDELLAVPDEQLPADRLEYKKKVKSLRAAAEAREKAKQLREQGKAEREAESARLEKRKKEDPEGYLKDLKSERDALIERRKKRAAAKQAGSDRRSQAARHRMRLLAQQIAGPGKKEEDTFGMNDSDWDVYREIEDGGEADEADDKQRLDEIDAEFREIAPEFSAAFTGPVKGSQTLFLPPQDPSTIYVVVDRIRTPEPSLIGLDQMGLGEAMALSLNSISDLTVRRKAIREVFLTGGFAKIPGLAERVRLELMRVLPTEWNQEINVSVANDASEDAWRGAALYGRETEHDAHHGWISRSDYEEMGPQYLREHLASNPFIPTEPLDRDKEEERRRRRRGQ